MMTPSAVVRNIPQQDLLNELKTFIAGTHKQDKQNSVELNKTALILLRKLPACRSAIFEYLCKVFDTAAYNYIQALEVSILGKAKGFLVCSHNFQTEINTGKLPIPPETDEVIVAEVHTALNTLITENSIAWAPTISTWSLELLGEISTRYSGRAHISSSSIYFKNQVNCYCNFVLEGLNETLQLWMGCRATRTLVDINTKCLSSLMHSDTEACISALLGSSSQ